MKRAAKAAETLERAADEKADLILVIRALGGAGDPQLEETLARLVDEERRGVLLLAEQRWLGRLGWRLARPLLGAAVLASPLFLLQDFVPPALGLALFVFGAAFFFVLLQIYLQRWMIRVERALEARDAERAGRLRALAARLRGDDDPA